MAQKHLHELLTEAQEPFRLKNYIANKRSQLKTTNGRNKKAKSAPCRTSFCSQSCFSSYTDTPDYAKPQEKNKDEFKAIHFDLSLLLEAAERIKNPKLGKIHNRNRSLAVLGSFFKKFTPHKAAKCEKVETLGGFLQSEDFVSGSSSSCSTSRRISTTESVEVESDGFSLSEKCTCTSPVSTFSSSFQNSPSMCLRSPEYSSPRTSSSIDIQGNIDDKCTLKKHSKEGEDYFSPVSILDPPFEDDSVQREDEDGNDEYDMESSYALVQRAKEQLLERLLRFEKLAELDPIELERCILETKADEDGIDDEDEEEFDENKSANSQKISKFDISNYMKKGDGIDERKIVERRVRKKVGLWEKMEFETKIEMIVELDLIKEAGYGWKTNDQENLEEIVVDIELYIIDFLVEELKDDIP